MLIRYKHWAVDGVSAHKAIRGASEYVFLDADAGLCDVRDRVGIEYLLARPANYELAYEVFGITFGADGQQVTAPASEIPTNVEKSPSKRKPGRPRKG